MSRAVYQHAEQHALSLAEHLILKHEPKFVFDASVPVSRACTFFAQHFCKIQTGKIGFSEVLSEVAETDGGGSSNGCVPACTPAYETSSSLVDISGGQMCVLVSCGCMSRLAPFLTGPCTSKGFQWSGG